LQVWSF